MSYTWPRPAQIPFSGKFVTLLPSDFVRDSAALYSASHGDAKLESIWDYMLYGPFASASEFQDFYTKLMTNKAEHLPWTIFDCASNEPVGFLALIEIQPEHGRAEIGHVWLTPKVHRSKINTEMQFLLLRYLFDELKYRRVEWKCNAQNHASRLAAARMGFVFEARFRQHMVIKGKNLDADRFAMIDKDWPRCRENFQRFLYGNENVSLSELNMGINAVPHTQ